MNNNVNDNLKEAQLYKFVTSDRNIYRAIYSLESYIEDLYLLDGANKDKNTDKDFGNSDLELYYILYDKYNFNVIKKGDTAKLPWMNFSDSAKNA